MLLSSSRQLGAENDSSTTDGSGGGGLAPNVVFETFQLEASSLPKVIGKGGARIGLIRQASHCKVRARYYTRVLYACMHLTVMFFVVFVNVPLRHSLE